MGTLLTLLCTILLWLNWLFDVLLNCLWILPHSAWWHGSSGMVNCRQPLRFIFLLIDCQNSSTHYVFSNSPDTHVCVISSGTPWGFYSESKVTLNWTYTIHFVNSLLRYMMQLSWFTIYNWKKKDQNIPFLTLQW